MLDRIRPIIAATTDFIDVAQHLIQAHQTGDHRTAPAVTVIASAHAITEVNEPVFTDYTPESGSVWDAIEPDTGRHLLAHLLANTFTGEPFVVVTKADIYNTSANRFVPGHISLLIRPQKDGPVAVTVWPMVDLQPADPDLFRPSATSRWIDLAQLITAYITANT